MRNYYYLSQLDESPYRLSISDALHLGSTERLVIYAFVPEQIAIKVEDIDEWNLVNSVYLGIPGYLTGALEREVIKAQSPLSDPKDSLTVLRQHHTLNRATIADKYAGLTAFPTLEPREPFYISVSHPNERDLRRPGSDYTVCLADLLVWTEDLDRLVKYDHIQRHSSTENRGVPADDDRQDYPPDLDALVIAWRKWWKNANRHDRSTHPKKDTVKSWLIEQGLSDRTADAGATIITPDWKK
jgi:hypothetical protein